MFALYHLCLYITSNVFQPQNDEWCASSYLSCLVQSSVIYSMCSVHPCFSHSLCTAVLKAVCVLELCGLGIRGLCREPGFVCLSFPQGCVLCVSVCVLQWRTDLADSTFSLIYAQCTHMCAHTAVSGYSASHTHNADLLFEMPPDTEISTSTASNAWPHLKIGMQSSSQQKYKDAGKKREWKWMKDRKIEKRELKARTMQARTNWKSESKSERNRKC